MLDDIVKHLDQQHANVNDHIKKGNPPPPDDIAPAIGAASRAMIAAMMVKVASKGFNDMTPAFAQLIPLLDATGARPTVLAQRAGITKQAISQLVRELETRGYLEQVADPTDTRAKIVRLTKRGMQLRTACMGVRRELQEIALAALGKVRLRRLRNDLWEVAGALGQVAQS